MEVPKSNLEKEVAGKFKRKSIKRKEEIRTQSEAQKEERESQLKHPKKRLRETK